MTGSDLKEWRRRHGNISQRRLVEMTGVSWATISNYEVGRTQIPLQFRLALAALENGLEPIGGNENR